MLSIKTEQRMNIKIHQTLSAHGFHRIPEGSRINARCVGRTVKFSSTVTGEVLHDNRLMN